MILALGVLLLLLAFGAYIVPWFLVFLMIAVPLIVGGIVLGAGGYHLWKKICGR